MINHNNEYFCSQKQASKGIFTYRYLWCLCLVLLCNISYAQEGQGAANNKQPTINIMYNNGESWLVGPNGMTLYSLIKEKAHLTTCVDGCASNWPPLIIKTNRPPTPSGLKGKVDTVKRLPPDNRIQVTYKGQQLHYWFGDKKPGDITGNGVGGIWFIARP